MSRPAANTAGRARRLALLMAAVWVPGLLMLAEHSEAYTDPSPAGPVSSGAHRPAANFTALEHPVTFYNRLFHAGETTEGFWATPTRSDHFFGEVTVDGRSGDLDLSFAVEGQPDPSGYRFCETSGNCEDVKVRVTSEGLLHLYKSSGMNFRFGFFADFPSLPVELSASDNDTDLKVYREVLVRPPTEVTGCDDYAANTPEAYKCLFLRELLPPGQADETDATTLTALRAGLPDLVQDAAEYSLAFSEEFDGTPPAADAKGCSDGLSTLSTAVWNYHDACDNVDSNGEPCANVVGGALVIASTGPCADFVVTSRGNLHAKYGYWEIKYTVNADHWSGQYSNYNLILIAGVESLRHHLDRYGIEVRGWQDYLTNLDVEIDIVEYEPGSRQDVAHQYGNWNSRFPGMTPIRTVKWNVLCSNWNSRSLSRNPKLPCRNTDTFTVTRGVEWTPRGYRTFIKVDGIHDEMIVAPKEKIVVQNRGRHGNVELYGSQRDPYFEHLVPGDSDSVLEQIVVSHVPLPVSAGAWGWLSGSYIRTRMKIDYIRLWQPENHYSDMEPVYR